MPLCKSHPIWHSAKNNPDKVSKALVQATMLSGRYRTEKLCQHWSKRDGTCLAPTCVGQKYCEDIEHILVYCPSLSETRSSVFNLWEKMTNQYSYLYPIVSKALSSGSTYFCQFTLDCTTLPEVIQLKTIFGDIVIDQLMYITRTFCHSVHRQRLKNLGCWKFK